MDSQELIKKLYEAGYNHKDIALKVLSERKQLGIPTTEQDCLHDVERILLEIHRRR